MRRRKPRPTPIAARWREYERRKAQFLRDLTPSPEDYERFIYELGKKLGL